MSSLNVAGNITTTCNYRFGTAGNVKSNGYDYISLSNTLGNASYTAYSNNTGNCIIGHYLSGAFVRNTNLFRLENSSGSIIHNLDVSNARIGVNNQSPLKTLDGVGDCLISSDFTVSGTLQSPITNLLSVSHNIISVHIRIL